LSLAATFKVRIWWWVLLVLLVATPAPPGRILRVQELAGGKKASDAGARSRQKIAAAEAIQKDRKVARGYNMLRLLRMLDRRRQRCTVFTARIMVVDSRTTGRQK